MIFLCKETLMSLKKRKARKQAKAKAKAALKKAVDKVVVEEITDEELDAAIEAEETLKSDSFLDRAKKFIK